MQSLSPVKVMAVAAVAFCVLSLSGCGKTGSGGGGFSLDTEYQAVFLDNGQVFFGKLSYTGSQYPQLKGIFYVQTHQNPETKEVRSILIKRGSEWHGPNSMQVNSKHIVIVEPVSADSKVAKLITEAEAEKVDVKAEDKNGSVLGR
jgi:hypothetical protein